jgi:hypothetical protein
LGGPGSGRRRKRVLVPGKLREAQKQNSFESPSIRATKNKREPALSEVAKLEERVNKIIKFIEDHCRCPEGRLMGQKLVLESWQREAIWAIYGNPVGTRRAIISIPRKASKTTFAACLLLVHLIGPMADKRENSQLYSAAQSRDQAALIFGAACKIINFNADMRALVKITESHKALINIELNIRYRALAADANTAFGLSPSFIVHDELGQICPRKQIKPLQNMGFQDGHLMDAVLSILPHSKRPDPHETWLSVALNRTAGKLRESIPWERETSPGRAKLPCDMSTPTLVSERNARAAFSIN